MGLCRITENQIICAKWVEDNDVIIRFGLYNRFKT